MVAPSLLKHGFIEGEDFDSRQESEKIRRQWKLRDRSAVHSYEQALAVRRIMEAKLACARAIPYLRCAAFSLYTFERWLEHHANWDNLPPNPSDWGACLGFAAPRRQPTSNPGMWGDHHGWGGVRDSAWDGSLVPKTPQKQKRRRQRRRERREQLVREWAEYEFRVKEMEARMAATERENGWKDSCA
ncbi:hypothetical protein FB451DRAFT_1399053 [Mycena latifolia]|nr:hypothetical protein FB451DRAFT_1399053 [Mycena latifolia]